MLVFHPAYNLTSSECLSTKLHGIWKGTSFESVWRVDPGIFYLVIDGFLPTEPIECCEFSDSCDVSAELACDPRLLPFPLCERHTRWIFLAATFCLSASAFGSSSGTDADRFLTSTDLIAFAGTGESSDVPDRVGLTAAAGFGLLCEPTDVPEGFGFTPPFPSGVLQPVDDACFSGLSSGGVDFDSTEIADVSILSSGSGAPRVTLNVFDRFAATTFLRSTVADPVRLELAGLVLRFVTGVLGVVLTGVLTGVLAGAGCSWDLSRRISWSFSLS